MKYGKVISLRDGILKLTMPTTPALGELVYVESNVQGKWLIAMVSGIRAGDSDAVLFDSDSLTGAGAQVRGTGRLFYTPVGMHLFGRVVDGLGRLQDKESLETYNSEYLIEASRLFEGSLVSVEQRAPGIVARKSVTRPLHTGVRTLDSLIPIGRGQRELIIGDRGVGKTTLAFDAMINIARGNNQYGAEQKLFNTEREKTWIIYVTIGQRKVMISDLWRKMKKFNITDSACIISAFASDAAPLQFIAAYTGCAQGEYVRDVLQGDCVIFYNDLSKHAVAYRQMSLLLRRPAGREAYPGDIFYIHSRLLERAAQLQSGGSLTAFPFIETQEGDITAYIPTNVISITDGQIFLDTSLFYKGLRPAVNIGLSVSRIGSAAQLPPMKRLVASLKLTMAQFREVEVFSRLAANVVNPATLRLIKRGRILTRLFVQHPEVPMSVVKQILTFDGALSGELDDVPVDLITDYLTGLDHFLDDEIALSDTDELDEILIGEIAGDKELVALIWNLFPVSYSSEEEISA